MDFGVLENRLGPWIGESERKRRNSRPRAATLPRSRFIKVKSLGALRAAKVLRFRRALETAAARTGDKGVFVGSFASRGAPSTRGIPARSDPRATTAHCPPKMDRGPTWEIEARSSPHPIHRSIHFRIRSSPMDLFRTYFVSSRRIEVLFTYSCHWNVNCLSENHVCSACCPATILLRGSNSTPPIVEKARTRGNWRAGLGAAGCRLTWAYARSSTLAALYARTIHAFREMSPSTARRNE